MEFMKRILLAAVNSVCKFCTNVVTNARGLCIMGLATIGTYKALSALALGSVISTIGAIGGVILLSV